MDEDLTTYPQDQIDRLAKKLAGFGRWKGQVGFLYRELAKSVKARDNAWYRLAMADLAALNNAPDYGHRPA